MAIKPLKGINFPGLEDTYIVDAFSMADTEAMLDTKQETLVSGTNIKTINGESLLGEGNLPVGTIVGDADFWATVSQSGYYEPMIQHLSMVTAGHVNTSFEATTARIWTMDSIPSTWIISESDNFVNNSGFDILIRASVSEASVPCTVIFYIDGVYITSATKADAVLAGAQSLVSFIWPNGGQLTVEAVSAVTNGPGAGILLAIQGYDASKGVLHPGQLGYNTSTGELKICESIASTWELATPAALSAAEGKLLSERISAITDNMEDLGGGDMMKATYDPDGDGKVLRAILADNAEFADMASQAGNASYLGGIPASDYALKEHEHPVYAAKIGDSAFWSGETVEIPSLEGLCINGNPNHVITFEDGVLKFSPNQNTGSQPWPFITEQDHFVNDSGEDIYLTATTSIKAGEEYYDDFSYINFYIDGEFIIQISDTTSLHTASFIWPKSTQLTANIRYDKAEYFMGIGYNPTLTLTGRSCVMLAPGQLGYNTSTKEYALATDEACLWNQANKITTDVSSSTVEHAGTASNLVYSQDGTDKIITAEQVDTKLSSLGGQIDSIIAGGTHVGSAAVAGDANKLDGHESDYFATKEQLEDKIDKVIPGKTGAIAAFDADGTLTPTIMTVQNILDYASDRDDAHHNDPYKHIDSKDVDELNFVDEAGNIIAKIDANGFETTKVNTRELLVDNVDIKNINTNIVIDFPQYSQSTSSYNPEDVTKIGNAIEAVDKTENPSITIKYGDNLYPAILKKTATLPPRIILNALVPSDTFEGIKIIQMVCSLDAAGKLQYVLPPPATGTYTVGDSGEWLADVGSGDVLTDDDIQEILDSLLPYTDSLVTDPLLAHAIDKLKTYVNTKITHASSNYVHRAEVINNLTSGATNMPLSAAQGKLLKSSINAIGEVLDTVSELSLENGEPVLTGPYNCHFEAHLPPTGTTEEIKKLNELNKNGTYDELFDLDGDGYLTSSDSTLLIDWAKFGPYNTGNAADNLMDFLFSSNREKVNARLVVDPTDFRKLISIKGTNMWGNQVEYNLLGLDGFGNIKSPFDSQPKLLWSGVCRGDDSVIEIAYIDFVSDDEVEKFFATKTLIIVGQTNTNYETTVTTIPLNMFIKNGGSIEYFSVKSASANNYYFVFKINPIVAAGSGDIPDRLTGFDITVPNTASGTSGIGGLINSSNNTGWIREVYIA